MYFILKNLKSFCGKKDTFDCARIRAQVFQLPIDCSIRTVYIIKFKNLKCIEYFNYSWNLNFYTFPRGYLHFGSFTGRLRGTYNIQAGYSSQAVICFISQYMGRNLGEKCLKSEEKLPYSTGIINIIMLTCNFSYSFWI